MTPRSDALIGLLERRGFARVDTPVLQEAGLFLDLSGEDIRRRLFLTQDNSGRELCLRPEHTIPVCLHHLRAGRAAANYSYLGPVFRQREGEPGEFLQAGIESFGRADADVADAEVLALALEGLDIFGGEGLEVTIGDMGLIEAVLAALEVPPAEKRRITRRLSAGRKIERVLSGAARPAGRDYSGLLAAIEGQDPRAARRFVEDVISISGVARVGGRTAGEIADRFLAQAANRSGALSEHARATLDRYFRIDGPADAALQSLRQLAAEARLDIEFAVARVARRLEMIAGRTDGPARLRFSASFARNFDYYSGFIFEVRSAASGAEVVAGGGRYDTLLRQLGSEEAVPAIGCSFWIDRLEEASR